MPIAWGRHDNKQIFLNVAILTAADASLIQEGTPLSNVQMFKALVDTGAMGTCITPQTAAKIGLLPIGKVPLRGVSGISYHNNYLFYIGFTIALGPISPSSPGASPQIQQELHLLPVPIQGAEFNAGGAFDVLLGMDVISTGSLKIEGNGTFSWAW